MISCSDTTAKNASSDGTRTLALKICFLQKVTNALNETKNIGKNKITNTLTGRMSVTNPNKKPINNANLVLGFDLNTKTK
tara:strand:+ start:570 stop:809 length:240 start_codon:yes stop_codon:yes gene_type:complete